MIALLTIYLKNTLDVVYITQRTGHSGHSGRLEEELVIGPGTRKVLEFIFLNKVPLTLTCSGQNGFDLTVISSSGSAMS